MSNNVDCPNCGHPYVVNGVCKGCHWSKQPPIPKHIDIVDAAVARVTCGRCGHPGVINGICHYCVPSYLRR